jgi:hypothetical protein
LKTACFLGAGLGFIVVAAIGLTGFICDAYGVIVVLFAIF